MASARRAAPADIFATPAHAQVNNEVSKVAQPIGFADIVERVKPSVISVKVNIEEKASSKDDDDAPFPPGSPMERFFRRFGGLRHAARFARHASRTRSPVKAPASSFQRTVTRSPTTMWVDGADKVEVTTDDGKTYKANVIGTDQRTDLALIKVEDGSNFPFAKLSGTKPRIGDWVLAVGNPFGLGGTVTAGIVSRAAATSVTVRMTISSRSMLP